MGHNRDCLHSFLQVLDAGHLKEFNEAYTLLRCRNSLLYQLVAQTGASEAQKLFDIARKKYLQRHPAKAKETSNKSAEEEMGALEVIEQDDLDEGVDTAGPKSEEASTGEPEVDGTEPQGSAPKESASQENAPQENASQEIEIKIVVEETKDEPADDAHDDEKASLLVGFKPESGDSDGKDKQA